MECRQGDYARRWLAAALLMVLLALGIWGGREAGLWDDVSVRIPLIDQLRGRSSHDGRIVIEYPAAQRRSAHRGPVTIAAAEPGDAAAEAVAKPSPPANAWRPSFTPVERLTPPMLIVPAPAVGEKIEPRTIAQPNATLEQPRHNHHASAWPEPRRLSLMLDELAEFDETRSWSQAVAADVQRLMASAGPHDEAAAQVMSSLREKTKAVGQLASAISSADLRSALRRAQHALQRRLDVWTAVAVRPESSSQRTISTSVNSQRVAVAVKRIEELLAPARHREGWRSYLMLEELSAHVEGSSFVTVSAWQDTAAAALDRLDNPELTPQQRKFVRSGPIADLAMALYAIVDEPVESQRFLAELEAAEWTTRPSDERRLAEALGRLERSDDEADAALAARLAEHYRIANVRVSITDDMLERFLPKQAPRVDRVAEYLLGIPVFGRATSDAQLSLKLLPTPGDRLNVELIATGTIQSRTRSSQGPVTTYNSTNSSYTARKLVQISEQGVHFEPSQVDVSSRTRLTGMSTDFDGIPIIEDLVRGYALNEYNDMRPAMQAAARARTATRTRQRFDESADPQMTTWSNALAHRVVEPLRRLDLNANGWVERPSEDRVALRFLLAGDNQLAAHTPRPMALSDSVLTVQLSQSAVNNLLDRLNLAGRTFTPSELFAEIGRKLNLPPEWLKRETLADARITFAQEDPVRIRFEDGRLRVALAIAVLAAEGNVWRDIEVFADYAPEQVGPAVELMRSGVVSLHGAKDTRSQFALRGIFSDVFHPDVTFPILYDQLTSDARFAGLQVTQFVLEDGWLGFALGPQAMGATEAAKAATRALWR